MKRKKIYLVADADGSGDVRLSVDEREPEYDPYGLYWFSFSGEGFGQEGLQLISKLLGDKMIRTGECLELEVKVVNSWEGINEEEDAD